MAAALAIVVFLPALVASNTACPPRLLSLLVQRAVQTCCFTSRQCRDPPTAEWLVGFGGHVGLETFHGIDGLRVPAEEYVLQLLRAPSEQITVHSALKKHRGLSASNPYLQPSTMTYMVMIQPADLADRVMRTAATIAAKWREDLPMIGPHTAQPCSQPCLYALHLCLSAMLHASAPRPQHQGNEGT